MDQRKSDRPIKKPGSTGRIKTALGKNVYAVYLIQIPIILFLQGRFV
jgi:hypothetical protein